MSTTRPPRRRGRASLPSPRAGQQTTAQQGRQEQREEEQREPVIAPKTAQPCSPITTQQERRPQSPQHRQRTSTSCLNSSRLEVEERRHSYPLISQSDPGSRRETA